MADEHEDEDDEESFELTLGLHGLLQIRNQSAQSAHTQQLEETEHCDALFEVVLQIAALLCRCVDDQAEEQRRGRDEVGYKAVFHVVLRNLLGRLDRLTVRGVHVGRKKSNDHVEDEEDVDEDFEDFEPDCGVVLLLNLGKRDLHGKSDCVVDCEQDDKYLPVEFVLVADLNDEPAPPCHVF